MAVFVFFCFRFFKGGAFFCFFKGREVNFFLFLKRRKVTAFLDSWFWSFYSDFFAFPLLLSF
ncbi:hypothetical protein RC74_10850 [Falsihalocynthiibacter arcticus]|uniref:Uncharacterized protein n=1 Tax=Falsihalocynthiibacter arcticus TaxID=1579316 RepID=A0A126V081_9RHOB|nr:hypothetical protein RC74_10850 [Falsihalocynthiibacter arcticus]